MSGEGSLYVRGRGHYVRRRVTMSGEGSLCPGEGSLCQGEGSLSGAGVTMSGGGVTHVMAVSNAIVLPIVTTQLVRASL